MANLLRSRGHERAGVQISQLLEEHDKGIGACTFHGDFGWLQAERAKVAHESFQNYVKLSSMSSVCHCPSGAVTSAHSLLD